ncbi:uncharacterized protein Dwil_GK27464 [Drosophila willistoni]|uniref:Uncharacterized protein n=1 Tax=Drosophila willistoni TaxID=7260 RepID=A0A0Q9WVW3_DROWI|nr:uncharacterized protein Dwil_GK27464 [Drosophila willistoni]
MYNSHNAWENCDFSCGENSFYGDDPTQFDLNELKPHQRSQLSDNGVLYGRVPINEPSVNFNLNNNGFYNRDPSTLLPHQQQQQRPFEGAMFNRSAGLLRYHPYQQQHHVPPQFLRQQQPPYYHPQQIRGNVLNLSTPCHVVENVQKPWSYAYCYGYAPSHPQPCQFSQFVDIEDFM